MAILTDIIVAQATDAPAIIAEWPGEKRWPALETTGLDYLLLSELAAALKEKALANTIETLDPSSSANEADGPWLYILPIELRDRMADLLPADVGAVATGWSKGEEAVNRGLAPADAERMVQAIQKLAIRARDEGKPMMLWISM